MFTFLFFILQIVSGLHEKPVYIALKQKNIEYLKRELEIRSDPLSAKYGQWMTKIEIQKNINPDIQDQLRVLDWINSYNISHIYNYGDSIVFKAQLPIIGSMFQLDTQKQSDIYNIPNHLLDIIDFVEMSTHKIDKHPKLNITTKGKADDRYFAREPLVNMYNLTEMPLHNISGGLIEYQNNEGFTNADLNLQQTGNNQMTQNLSRVVGINQGYDAESELDVQLMSQSADGLDLWYWQSPYWLYSFAVDYFNAEDSPDIISMSWGWSQADQCDITSCGNITSQQYVERVNNEYVKIALLGKTIVVASGDAGAPGRTNEDCELHSPINPVFPGSSPYVLSVGATFVPFEYNKANYTSPLCKNNTCIVSKNEQTISYDHVEWTSGGGFDRYENNTPIWQKNVVDAYMSSGVILPIEKNFNKNGRAYPDVSAIGHRCPTYIDGELTTVDGTSCSAPVMAGILSYLNQYMWTRFKIRLGFVNPLLYYIYHNCHNCIKDITNGYNWCTEQMCCDQKTDYGFTATKGYDPVSGLGTLNIGNILTFLDTNLV